MKRKELSLFSALLLATLASVGCGGEDLFGTKCPADGHALAAKKYTSVTVTSASDSCDSTVTTTAVQADLTSITVENDTTNMMCVITVKGAGGGELGHGAISNNSGVLTFSQMESDTVSGCQYQATLSAAVTVTADNTFQLTFTEIDDGYQSLAGKSCNKNGKTCTFTYTANVQ